MIIDAKTVTLTLIVVSIAFYGGVRLVRAFALSIAQENHDANRAIDQAEQKQQAKRAKMADAAAAASGFTKVEPMVLTVVPKDEKVAEPATEMDTI
jgi:hypothetical protein